MNYSTIFCEIRKRGAVAGAEVPATAASVTRQ